MVELGAGVGESPGMMRPSNDLPSVYLCREPVDFRKGLGALAVLVESALWLDPFSEQLFVFCNRGRNRVKVLYWERNGFCLWQKRLEGERFYWPKSVEAVLTLSGQQLNWLLDGYDISRLKPHKTLCFSSLL
ncbi:MAG: IS66 family insertion sequence element accessory protein TnpB [Gammaproteobacteria bacterium]